LLDDYRFWWERDPELKSLAVSLLTVFFKAKI
jgi:hypothetical protein